MRLSKRIALCGISAAFAALLISFGNLVPLFDLSMYFFASIFVMLPISRGDLVGGVIVFIAAGLIGLFSAPNVIALLPYAIFFGSYPVFSAWLDRICPSRMVKWIPKILFFEVALFVLYRFTTLFLEGGVAVVTYPVLAIVGIAFLFLYDVALEMAKRTLARMTRKFF